ncbi:exosortase B [Glaciimonas sp. CA11.2]|uniref:exosortase B n=1 Tax=Glaciimonas sp. CA11.2 TaxID=3048601 RepID=UPI002AB5AA65|nr:exosortase B [Glaciimonas sp. CA11.2]MDY7547876.1 exosortase B [Glaciimonas sp. CA11.2]
MNNGLTISGRNTLTASKKIFAVWWPLIVGLLILYVPTFFDLATGIWISEDNAHGPIILSLAVWLMIINWPNMLNRSEGEKGNVIGWPISIFGLLLYIVGRSQGILLFETASFIVLLIGILLVIKGGEAFKAQWFPFFFMLFMVPLPGSIVIAVTLPMKMAVSFVTEHVLYLAGYPIARSGVILQIGQYQLMVADACAGLHTLLTLEALGLFYLNVVRHTATIRNVVLAILIVPISFTANVIRVMALTLITYYLGDAAGQGFLHGFAGMVLFLSALMLIITTDSLLRFIVKTRVKKYGNPESTR